MGTLWSVGYGLHKHLCNGSTSTVTTPTQAGVVDSWAFVAARDDGSSGCAYLIRDDGTLWVAGANNDRLGLGAGNADKLTPFQSGTSSNWVHAAVGNYVAYAINSDGELWAAGWATNGQFGNGTNGTTLSTLTKIGTDTDWEKVFAGNTFALAIKTDGSLWACGSNGSGTLCAGTTTNPLTTWTRVGTASNWVHVHTQGGGYLALDAAGDVWGAGGSGDGQHGNGTTTFRTSLFKNTLLSNITKIGGGDSQGLAVDSTGRLHVWGYNQGGRLGLGHSTTPVTSATQVGTGTDWVDVGSNQADALIARSASGVYACGKNNYKQGGVSVATDPLTSWTASNYDPETILGYYSDASSVFIVPLPPAVVTAPITVTVNANTGAVSAPVKVSVTAQGYATGAIQVGVVDALETTDFNARVTLNGTDISARLKGVLTVRAEEGMARMAECIILPMPGVVLPTAWTGAAITIDLLRVIGGALVPARVFTGLVDLAEFDPVTRLVKFTCTDDLQNKVAALTRAQIDTLTGGRFSVAVQGQIDERWDYAQARMESRPASLDASAFGGLRVTDWDGLSVWRTFTDADIFSDSITLDLPRRVSIVNQIDATFQYRYSRCRERRAHVSWSASIFGTDAAARGYQFPTQDTIEAALEGTGWHRLSTSYGNAPATVPSSPAGWYIETGGGVANMSASLAQRHAQTVTEAYSLTISAPSSIAANGVLAYPLNGALASSWTANEWESDYTITVPDASTGDVDYGGDETRSAADDAMLCLLDVAKTKILATHRQCLVSFSVPCLPEIDLTHAVELDSASVSASGKVARIVHTIDLEVGRAETRITLALSGIASAGIVSPDVLDVPPAPDVDDATGEDPWSANIPALLTHVGAYNANYSEDMMGFLINAPAAYLKTDGADSESVTNAYYDEAYTFPSTGFRIQLPGVADTHRQPLEIEVAQSYAVEIPENPLTLEVL
jgi:alpha-tubulin suppressor-like RCC1 family protein